LRTYNYAIATACWVVMLIVIILGKYAIRLEPILWLDRQILEWFAASRMVALDYFFASVTCAGSIFFLLPLILLVVVLLMVNKHFQEALFVIGSFVGASLLTTVFKRVVARPRPDLYSPIFEIPDGFSFPSSHASQITAFVLIWILMQKFSTRSSWLIFLKMFGGLLIFLVCLSRPYLQVHYPTDVIAGFFIAFFWVVGLATLILPDYHDLSITYRGYQINKGKQL
jgi:undecaprenyl-diphosphatase